MSILPIREIAIIFLKSLAMMKFYFRALFDLCTIFEGSGVRRWSRKFSWKVADRVATHSKPYWCKGDGWLIMVDIYTMLHKRIGEGGWLAILSTPLDQPLVTCLLRSMVIGSCMMHVRYSSIMTCSGYTSPAVIRWQIHSCAWLLR